MSKIDLLLKAYERFVNLPWQQNLSGREKVWFCIYDPRDERRLRARLPEFEMATRNAGHGWVLRDITAKFEEWMAANEYRESYFAEPGLLTPALDTFLDDLAEQLHMEAEAVDMNTIFAVLGVGALFGITRVSTLVEHIAGSIKGRLLVFFPGTRDGSNYRLLDARDGWNYLAVPIEAEVREG